QDQFLKLATAEEAAKKFYDVIKPRTLGEEKVPLINCLDRILSRDVISKINVPFFDRSNFDGLAVRAEDTFGAEETEPIGLALNTERLASGVLPKVTLVKGSATVIATGGVLPRGANAVVMIENTLPGEGTIKILKPAVPGTGVAFAGSDIGAGETVLRQGERLTSRETGVLSAIGVTEIWVLKKPRVGIISTGDEIIAPGAEMEIGKVYDTNGVIVANVLKEIGCEPVSFGIVPDNEAELEKVIRKALSLDFIILSGGTSKGEGDLNYRVIEKIGNPGIIVHGVALKPGKPLCLAAVNNTPVAILPGFPTSAIFTFTKFIVPPLKIMAGFSVDAEVGIEAFIPMRLNSQKGKTEFEMVNLVTSKEGYAAYSMGKGSGSITTFAKADGYIEIPRQTEQLQSGEKVRVHLLGRSTRPADLIFIGSQCLGVDYLISLMQQQGFNCKVIPVGSMGGIRAAKRGECDIAGSHLVNEEGIYNSYLLDEKQLLVKGYGRQQGILYRQETVLFKQLKYDLEDVLRNVMEDREIRLINRNRGSGTRVIIDDLLKGKKPEGYYSETKSHNAVGATILQKRADWGIAIERVALDMGLSFFPLQNEDYDFVIPKNRLEKPAIKAFLHLLNLDTTQNHLKALGFKL
ncbi:MAG: molybdopterin biosynthesis protein, partial [Proteobacteria bacterium]|nr:molybdopterin biosynthesis protein [Pseudomonadota bacterium]